MSYFAGQTGKIHWGEYTALAWRKVPEFSELYPEGKILHIIRDPRAVLASWKKLSSIPNNAYLNAIFNWIDSANYAQKYTVMDPSSEKYKCVKYEDIMMEPESNIRDICEFLELEFDPKMLMPDIWGEELTKTKVVSIPRSAHDGPNVVGFSTKRISNWKNSLPEQDINLVDFLCDRQMDHFGYDKFNSSVNVTELQKTIGRLRNNPLLLENYQRYIAYGEGSSEYPTDPTIPTSWGAPGEPSKWFVESDVADDYFAERKAIIEKYDMINLKGLK